MSFSLEYIERVRNVLLAHDTRGISLRDLNQKVRGRKYKTSDLLPILDSWQQRQWVDRYRYQPPGVGHPIIYYRATEKLLKEWPIVQTVVEEALMGSPLVLDQSQT